MGGVTIRWRQSSVTTETQYPVMSYNAPLLPMRGGSGAPRTPARCAWRLPATTAAKPTKRHHRDTSIAMRRVYDKLMLSFVKRKGSKARCRPASQSRSAETSLGEAGTSACATSLFVYFREPLRRENLRLPNSPNRALGRDLIRQRIKTSRSRLPMLLRTRRATFLF